MIDTKNAGPRDETGTFLNATAAVEDTADQRRDDQLRDAAAGYAVLVETGEGRYRRRLFLTLASAERAVNRARERGRYAYLVLVTVTPVAVVQ